MVINLVILNRKSFSLKTSVLRAGKESCGITMPNIVMPFSENSVEAKTEEQKESRGLKTSMKPLLWCLKAAGLLHGLNLGRVVKGNGEVCGNKSRCRRFFSADRVYCLVVLFLLWVNFAYSLTVFEGATSFNGEVCNQIITSTWFLQVACFATNNILVFTKWNSVFIQWDQLAKDLDLKLEKVCRYIALCVCVLYMIWVLASLAFFVLGPYVVYGFTGIQWSNAGKGAFNVFQYIALFYFESAWYLLTALFVLIAYTLYRAFRHFANEFGSAINEKGGLNGDIEHYRLRHEELTRLLRSVDDIFSVYVLAAIGTVIPLIIFTLYFVLFETIDTFSYIATWWSVSLSLIQITCVFIAGGIVNHAAHSPLANIYRLDLRKLTTESCQQVSVFLNQLTSTPIGFSAFGLFIIDKPTIITFAGSIVTYAVVVIQFKPSSNTADTAHSFMNCSCP